MTRPRPLDYLVYFACLIFAFWLMFSTFAYQRGQFIIDSKLYSDFAAHLPLIRSFSLGHNFPVEYPTFAHAPIRYHFLFYALTASLEQAGLNLALAFNLLSSLGFALLLILIYTYGRLIRSRATGILAMFLFLFNGSLGFLEFFKTHPLGLVSLPAILHNQTFPSFGPWDGNLVAAFWNLNIYTNQRHLGMSFALALLALYPFVRALYLKTTPRFSQFIWLSLLGFLLPWLHQAAAFIVIWCLTLLFFLNFRRLKPWFPWYLILTVCTLPGLIYYATLGGEHLAVILGFLSADLSPKGMLIYWLYNLGLYLLLLPMVFISQNRIGRTLLFTAFTLFLGANLIRLSPDMINNHKLVNFFMLIVAIYTASWLTGLWRHHRPTRWLVPPLIFGLTLSGVIDFFPIFNDYSLRVADLAANPAAHWIATSTQPQSVFLTTSYLYNPASLAGRKTYLDYGYFNWSMGYAETGRRQLLSELFSADLSQAQICRLLHHERLDYVLIAPGSGSLGIIDPHQSVIARFFTPAYTSPDGYTIYAVAANCPLP